ncbi:MAG TPA: Gfo/Idh/MocA family oxidoreductase [Verrucomicrobiae bacterium]|nr:Gfo/Idh/MocA family oxidoreductase [Verrucomicrobiae bacterium]
MNPPSRRNLNRRRFLANTLLAGASASFAMSPGLAAETNSIRAAGLLARKIKLGLIGCGGRGSWIGGLFKKHGGFELHAVADYFPEVAKAVGDTLGVEASRRFSTLSGYKRVLESGIEAVALETPPYFFPEYARAAVAAGLHVYLAKPVAVDVPGCLQIDAAAKQATRQGRCFFVDYQLPTDPANQEVKQRIGSEGFGKTIRLVTSGICGGFPDPPRTANMESRLRNLVWVNDIAMGCDYLGNYDIHAIDAALWVLGERPLAASGTSRIARPNPHGDSHDVCTVLYEYPSGVVHDHVGQALKNFSGDDLSCRIYGQTGNAYLTYWNKAQFRSYDDVFTGEASNLYEAGVVRNIASFYRNIVEEHFGNDTVSRAVDGALACVLGREAAERRQRLTMEQVIKENRKLEVDLSGLS